jgi:hypothetical protein
MARFFGEKRTLCERPFRAAPEGRQCGIFEYRRRGSARCVEGRQEKREKRKEKREKRKEKREKRKEKFKRIGRWGTRDGARPRAANASDT